MFKSLTALTEGRPGEGEERRRERGREGESREEEGEERERERGREFYDSVYVHVKDAY